MVDNWAHSLSVDLTPKSNMKENQEGIVENGGGHLLYDFPFVPLPFNGWLAAQQGISLFLISF